MCPPFYVSPEQARDILWLLLCAIAENTRCESFYLRLRDFPCDASMDNGRRRGLFGKTRGSPSLAHVKESAISLNSFVISAEDCSLVATPLVRSGAEDYHSGIVTRVNSSLFSIPPSDSDAQRSKRNGGSGSFRNESRGVAPLSLPVHRHHHTVREEWMHDAARVLAIPFSMLLYHECEAVAVVDTDMANHDKASSLDHYHHPYNDVHNHTMFYVSRLRGARLQELAAAARCSSVLKSKSTLCDVQQHVAINGRSMVFGLQSAAEEAAVLSQEELHLLRHATDIWTVLCRSVKNYNGCHNSQSAASGTSDSGQQQQLWAKHINLESCIQSIQGGGDTLWEGRVLQVQVFQRKVEW